MCVLPYDVEWPVRFEAERLVLEETLAPWLDGEVEHVGSTAVPGLAAKPIIDMIAPVTDLEAARDAFGLLAALGYEYREHRPEAHAFHKPAPAAWWQATHFARPACRCCKPVRGRQVPDRLESPRDGGHHAQERRGAPQSGRPRQTGGVRPAPRLASPKH